MRRVIDAKFDSNKQFREKLLATADSELIEARKDRRWGIGLGVADARKQGRGAWGENWLGIQLMETRERCSHL